MTSRTKFMILMGAVFSIILGISILSIADDENHNEKSSIYKVLKWDDDDEGNGHRRRRYRKRHRDEDHEGSHIKPVINATYEAGCGECHFLYQPELLPSASWIRILDQLNDHFGEVLELEPGSKIIISEYLKSNSAENSSAKCAVKIMRSIGNQVPMRITDTPYIIKKHHELKPEVLARESIGSLSNCIACHTTADNGIYNEDHVKIPQ